MAVFNGQTITDKGRELLARALAGEGEFQFTGAAFGDQKHTGDIAIVEELKNKKLDLLVMDTVNDRGTVKVTIQITNETVAESFYTEEFGVYAKLKGDANEILYSYAIASKPDAIPNNKLGTTFEAVHEIFMDISSNTEATIDVNESIVFLTLDIANKNYTKTGLIARGVLEGRTSLEADKQYQDSNGNWHKNIGGDRDWDGSPDTDGQFAQLTWDELYEGKEPKFNKNSGFNLNISHAINSTSKFLVASALAVKTAYDKALEAVGFTNTNKNAIQNNTEQIENLSEVSDLLWQGAHTSTTTLPIPNLGLYKKVYVELAIGTGRADKAPQQTVYKNADGIACVFSSDEVGMATWRLDFNAETIAKVEERALGSDDTIYRIVGLLKV